MKKAIIALCIAAVSATVYAEEASPSADNGKTKPFSAMDFFSLNKETEKNKDEQRWFFNASGMYIRKTGNTDSVDSSYSSSLKYDNNIIESGVSYAGFYGKASGICDENKGNGFFNFDYYVFSPLEIFTYVQAEYDRMIELRCRYNAGVGLKFVFFRNDYWKADLSGAPVYQYENYGDLSADKEWRWSIRGRILIGPKNETFSVRYVYFYIPLMNDYRIYRQSHDVSMSVKMQKYILFKAGYNYSYDAEIPSEKKKTDMRYYVQAGITI